MNKLFSLISSYTEKIYAIDSKISASLNGFILVLIKPFHKSIKNSYFNYFSERAASLMKNNAGRWLLILGAAGCISLSVFKYHGWIVIFWAVTILAFIRPVWAVALLSFFLVLDTRADIAGGTTVFTNQFMLLMIAFGSAYRLTASGIDRRRVYPGIFFIILLLFFSLIPLIYMPNAGAVIKSIIKQSELFVIALITLMFYSNTRDLKLILVSMSFSIFLLLVVSVHQLFFDFEFLQTITLSKNFEIPRIDGNIGVTTFPAFLNLLVPISFLMFLLYRKNKMLRSVLFLAAVLILASVIALPFSRAGWLVFILVFLFIIYGFIKKLIPPEKYAKDFIIFIVSGFIVSFIFLSIITNLNALAALKARALNSWKEDTSSFASAVNRVFFLKMGIKISKDYPFGIGPGNYSKTAYKYIKETDIDPAFAHHLHSLYTQTLVEKGIPGLITLLLFALYLFGLIMRYFNKEPGENKIILFLLSACLIAFFTQSLFDVFIVFSRGIFAGIILGVLVGYINLLNKNTDRLGSS